MSPSTRRSYDAMKQGSCTIVVNLQASGVAWTMYFSNEFALLGVMSNIINSLVTVFVQFLRDTAI